MLNFRSVQDSHVVRQTLGRQLSSESAVYVPKSIQQCPCHQLGFHGHRSTNLRLGDTLVVELEDQSSLAPPPSKKHTNSLGWRRAANLVSCSPSAPLSKAQSTYTKLLGSLLKLSEVLHHLHLSWSGWVCNESVVRWTCRENVAPTRTEWGIVYVVGLVAVVPYRGQREDH
jgi:hypothetical protein